MKVFILTDCYFPHPKSISFLIRDLGLELRARSNDVTILTADPGLDQPVEESWQNGLRVIRVRALSTKLRWLPARALAEIMQPWLVWWVARSWFRANRHDQIIYFSPSAFWGTLVKRLKSLWGCKTYMVQRDIFPEWLVQLKLVKSPLGISLLKKLTQEQYRVADTIGAQSRKDVIYLRAKLAPSGPPVELLYNWRDSQHRVIPDPDFRFRFGISNDDVVFFFGGTFSASQSADDILGLVSAIAQKSNRVHFFFLGGGSRFDHLRKEAAARGLQKCSFEDSVPLNRYLQILAACDVGCLTLDGRYQFDNIPGRAFDYMLCRKPLLAALNPTNEFLATIQSKKMGIAHSISETELLANGALKLIESPRLRKLWGNNAYRVLETEFSPGRAVDQIQSPFHAQEKSKIKIRA